MSITISKLIEIQLVEVLVINNTFLLGYGGTGISINPSSNNRDVVFSIISSKFKANEGSDVWCIMQGHNKTSIAINNSSFSDNVKANDSIVAALSILSEAHTVAVTLDSVQFDNNSIGISRISLIHGVAGVVSIITLSAAVEISMYMVNFTTSNYSGPVGGALYILLTGNTNSNFNMTCKRMPFYKQCVTRSWSSFVHLHRTISRKQHTNRVHTF